MEQVDMSVLPDWPRLQFERIDKTKKFSLTFVFKLGDLDYYLNIEDNQLCPVSTFIFIIYS